MPYGSKDDYYESASMLDQSMGRKRPKKIRRKRTRPSLGTGMAESAATAIERRKRMLRDI